MYFIVLHGGFITKAGAVCLELLTPQGWVGGYTIESIIVQLAVTLVQGEARINFSALPKNIYTLQGKVFLTSSIFGHCAFSANCVFRQ